MKPQTVTSRFCHRFLRRFLRSLRRIGIRIDPFLVVREGETPIDTDYDENAYTFGFLAEADLAIIARLQPEFSREKASDWLRMGRLCYGVKNGSRLVANMWCDLVEFNHPPNYRLLSDDEVYLFAGYTHPEFRGHNLAPKMRAACYEALRTMGRSRFYSYTDFYNTAARRFKAKLNARDEMLRLHVDLFGKYSKTLTLKRFD